eukprot:scaffold19515_cov31-Tisochrysis_lutea.AAC.1
MLLGGALACVLGLLPAQPTGRRELLHAIPLVAAGLSTQLAPPIAAHAASGSAAKVTDRVFMDVRVIQRYDVEVLEDAAVRGRIVFGLFGADAPQAVQRFLDFTKGTIGQFAQRADGPSYASSGFEKLRPNEVVEGGRITGFDQEPFAGVMEYQYRSRLVPLRPLLEVNSLRHDRRGLLTKKRLTPGPEFAITLGAAPKLDGSHEVFGEILDGANILELIETLPYITGSSNEGKGTAADAVFNAQRAFMLSIAKGAGDTRAADRTGQLLRRVEITKVGVL